MCLHIMYLGAYCRGSWPAIPKTIFFEALYLNISLLRCSFHREETAAICASPNTAHRVCAAVREVVPCVADAQRCCQQFTRSVVGFFFAFSLANLETVPDHKWQTWIQKCQSF